MKKVAFILAGLLVIMLAGCGEGSSSAGGSVNTIDTTSSEANKIDSTEAAQTTVTNEFGLNPALGAPPPLPAS
ncbi:MAG: hypothetical protein OQJ77_07570 [Thiovulaceae bacterium]|nr:hypothetical protein [Sulfurimonadaceae bacterium]MCW9027162.1 hypothetical protein [Sulfurimonadaceae bacterium]